MQTWFSRALWRRVFTVAFVLVSLIAFPSGGAAESGCPGLAELVAVDSHGYLADIAVSGSLLVAIESGYGVTTWSLDDPDHPARLGSWA